MLSEVMRSVAREVGFTIISHELGFTAIRETDDRYLLFCLDTGEWQIFDAKTAGLVSGGIGLGSFLTAARQYFDLPAEAAETALKDHAA